MQLNTRQTRYLRSLAHHLNPRVVVGKLGLSPALIKEVDRNLEDHELIKVRISSEDRSGRDAAAEELREAAKAALVQRIGNVAVYYRPSSVEPTIVLPS